MVFRENGYRVFFSKGRVIRVKGDGTAGRWDVGDGRVSQGWLVRFEVSGDCEYGVEGIRLLLLLLLVVGCLVGWEMRN